MEALTDYKDHDVKIGTLKIRLVVGDIEMRKGCLLLETVMCSLCNYPMYQVYEERHRSVTGVDGKEYNKITHSTDIDGYEVCHCKNCGNQRKFYIMQDIGT